MFKKILVPLDGSDLSEQALPLALDLAVAGQAEVILLRGVIPVHLGMPAVAGEYDWQWPVHSLEDARREVRHYLRDIQASHENPELTLWPLTVEGDAASVIVDTAAEEEVDLIVMSSHGWSGRTRWSLGGITERVLHSTHCPVLVVRSQEPITHLLMALDGSKLAEQSLAPGVEVARRLGARLTLFRANEPVILDQPPTFVFDWEKTEVGRRWQNRTHEEAMLYLEDMRQDIEDEDLVVQTAVLDGPTVETIMDYVSDHPVQLIVMTTHGRSGLRRWLYGSVTAKVLRNSDCNILVIRPPDAALN